VKSAILAILQQRARVSGQRCSDLSNNRIKEKSGEPMAIKSTIYKAEVQIADMDRHYYQTHALTLARHPSETDERMMMRVLAFIRHASESLVFGKGIAADDEPDLWQKDLTGAIMLWIEVGQPDEKRILKACGRSEQVVIYTYSSNSAIWWNQIGSRIDRAKNLTVINIASATSIGLSKLAQRNMQLQCTVQDGQIWVTANDATVEIDFVTLKAAQGR
jgi:uncharacterized protein YaeQ